MHSTSLTVMILAVACTSVLSARFQTRPETRTRRAEPGASCHVQPRRVMTVSFPLTFDNFPNVTQGSANDTDVSERAQGTRPNIPPPSSVSPDTLTIIQNAAQTGFFRVAFISQLLSNIRRERYGYLIKDSSDRDYATDALQSILAQEEQHTLATNDLLTSLGETPVQPCKYYWPSFAKDFNSAIYGLDFYTEIFLGALQTVITSLGANNDTALIPAFVSVVQHAGQQAGWYRSVNNKIPAPSPFPTQVRQIFFTSFLNQQAIVPGSCSNSSSNGTDLEPLIIANKPITCTDVDQIVGYSISGNDTEIADLEDLMVAYVNQHNVPIFEPVMNVQTDGDCLTFDALYPCSNPSFGQGLTVVSLVNQTSPDIDGVTQNSVFGPAFIYMN